MVASPAMASAAAADIARRLGQPSAGAVWLSAGAGWALRLMPLAVGLWFATTGLLQPFQQWVGDARFHLLQRSPTGQVALVDIDARSIAALGVWPWGRAVHGRIVDELRTLGVADIAFDVDFSSRSAPDGDAAFEDALKRAGGSVILAAFRQNASAHEAAGAAAEVVNRPLPRFAQNAWEGSVNVRLDPDGRIRRFDRGDTFGSEVVPSLAGLLGAGGDDPTGAPFGIDYGIAANRFDHVSVDDLLNHRVEPGRLSGKKVIVGGTAIELRDYFAVPRFGMLPGPLVQALAADSLLQNRALAVPPTIVSVVLAAVVLAMATLLFGRLPYKPFLACCAVLAATVEAGAVLVQRALPVEPVTAPVHAGLLLFALGVVLLEIRTRRTHLLASRRDTARLQLILDRVVADNFAGIVVVDRGGLLRAVSAAAWRILATEPATVLGQPCAEVLPAALLPPLEDALRDARRGVVEPQSGREVEIVDARGNALILDCVTTISAVPASRQSGPELMAVCLTFQDITAKRQAERRLAEMARTDSLTGLSNRHVFLERLQALAATDTAFCRAVIFFDLDRFKLVNDRLGHTVGDALLREVADRLATALAPGDVAARLGGDEFALLVARPSEQGVRGLADALVSQVGGTFTCEGYRMSVGVSVGLAFFADAGQDGEVMRDADAALQAAKMAGGDRVGVFDLALRRAIEDGKKLEQDLREALLLGSFQVFYQRQVNLATEIVTGVEALVRWRHAERGFVSPALFIPVAERTGLIDQIGDFVLRRACADAAQWPLPIKVSVNLSAVQLAKAGLAGSVLDALASSGLSPDRLDLEMTESMLMEQDGHAGRTLATLRGQGISVSLDDFGTGYSSLSYLKTFPIDKIKIDQSFVRDLPGNAASAAIIQAVVGLARSLGLRVNAEGVETPGQMALLRQLGCDEVQGFLHGRPEPSAAIVASLEQQLLRMAG